MIDSIIIVIFYVVLAVTLLYSLSNWLRAGVFDVRQAKLQRKWAKFPNSRRLRQRPSISALVYARNDATNIEACLNCLINSYKKLDITVVNNASRDKTKEIVKAYIKLHSQKSIKLITKRQPVKRFDAIGAAAQKINGDLVLVIDASCQLEAGAIQSMVRQMSEPTTDAVIPNIQLAHNNQLFGLSRKMRAILSIWSKKAGSFITADQDAYNYAALYRRELFKSASKPAYRPALQNLNALRQLSKNVTYDGEAIVIARKAPRKQPYLYKASIGRFGLSLLTLAEPLLAIFMIYIAFRFNNAGYILLAWLCFSVVLLLSIWSDESRRWYAKVGISLIALVAYSLHLIQAVLQLIQQPVLRIIPRLSSA